MDGRINIHLLYLFLCKFASANGNRKINTVVFDNAFFCALQFLASLTTANKIAYQQIHVSAFTVCFVVALKCHKMATV